jgi:alkane 1-monooxygenase
MVLLLAWSAAPGDLFGLGAWLQSWLGGHILERHASMTPLEGVGIALSAGYLLSTNTVAAHELIHRTHDPVSMAAGRWLLAVIGDTQFSISHVYNHHRWVGTPFDPATARREESLYHFFARSSLGQLAAAFTIEQERMHKLGKPEYSIHNRFWRGQLMTMILLVAMYGLAGTTGLLMYIGAMLYSKLLYETVNYIQHYGLVRAPDAQVEPRHSWDCGSWASSAFLFNLTRHADHHARATVPFWKLQISDQAPLIKWGYMGAIILSMIPPLWRRMMAPALRAWDEALATREERMLLATQSSGSFFLRHPKDTGR